MPGAAGVSGAEFRGGFDGGGTGPGNDGATSAPLAPPGGGANVGVPVEISPFEIGPPGIGLGGAPGIGAASEDPLGSGTFGEIGIEYVGLVVMIGLAGAGEANAGDE